MAAFNPSSYDEAGVFKLIDLVKEKTVIWNKEDGDIRKIDEKNAAWLEVAALFRDENLNWTDDKMKMCWKTLVRYYRRHSHRDQEMKYIPQLAFLSQSIHASRSYYEPPTPVSTGQMINENDDSEDEVEDMVTSNITLFEQMMNEQTSSSDHGEDGEMRLSFREELEALLIKLMESNDEHRILMERLLCDQLYDIGQEFQNQRM